MKLIGDGKPVTSREEHVEEHQAGPQPHRRRERRGLVLGLADDLEALALEQGAREAAEAGVVVDDQDAADTGSYSHVATSGLTLELQRFQGFHRGAARQAERTVAASEPRRS